MKINMVNLSNVLYFVIAPAVDLYRVSYIGKSWLQTKKDIWGGVTHICVDNLTITG